MYEDGDVGDGDNIDDDDDDDDDDDHDEDGRRCRPMAMTFTDDNVEFHFISAFSYCTVFI